MQSWAAENQYTALREFEPSRANRGPEMTKRRKLLLIGMLAAAICLFAVAVLTYRPMAVVYHRNRMNASYEKIRQVGPEDPKQEYWIDAYEHHKGRLVDLRYFQRREYILQHMARDSIESRRLWEELNAKWKELSEKVPHRIDVSMGEDAASDSDRIVVFDCPENLPIWEEIVLAHDQPPGSCAPIDKDSALPFLGTWCHDEGEESLAISISEPGRLEITSPDVEDWKTVTKNIRVVDGRLMFDQYWYVPPSDDYKSPINRSGHLGFSGVRMASVLERVPGDPDRLLQSVTTIHTTEPITGELHRMKEE